MSGARPWLALLRAAPAHLASARAARRAGVAVAGPLQGPLDAPLDAIVVLGHRPALDAHGLEYETRMRVEHGLELLRKGRAPRLLFSGGASTPGVVEADVMAAYAVQAGLPEALLLRERTSLDTLENARLSVALLRTELALSRAPRIALVTSDYHADRAERVFREAGAEVEGCPVTLALTPRERARRARGESWVRACYRIYDGLRRQQSW